MNSLAEVDWENWQAKDPATLVFVFRDDEVLLILEGGTVLRIDSDGETENRGSIWDVTDESTSPAIKVLLLDG